MEELRVQVNLYLRLREGETEEQAVRRMDNILSEAEASNSGFSVSEYYEQEIRVSE